GTHYFVAREYLEGQPLAELMRRASATGGLPLAMQLRIVADALVGLHHAHQHLGSDGLEIVHRDFSPSNIFVLYDGTVKIVDFGIAKTAYNGKTKADIFKGKLQYVAPEQFSSRPIGRRTDIYSAGVILWEAATQRRMWNGLNDLAVAQRIAAADIPLPSSIEPGIPKRLEAICMRALSARAEDRYPTAAHFRADLESFLVELGDPSPDEVGKCVAELTADLRTRFDDLVQEQMQRWRDETDALSLAPTVTSPRTLLKDLAGSGLPPPPRLPRKKSSTIAFVASGVLGVLSGLVAIEASRVWWGGKSSEGEPKAATQAMPMTTMANGPSPTRAVLPLDSSKRMVLKIATVPSLAKVGIDGSFLPLDAHDAVMAKDDAAHRVWAEAPGYQSKAEWVRLDQDQVSVTLTLTANPSTSLPRETPSPRPNAARTNSSQPAREAAPAAVRLDAARNTSTARVRLDTDDPWKN
ncbi:MAG TPA: serine/threonine-protein kinase, partial [Polyangiaceae bacterium]